MSSSIIIVMSIFFYGVPVVFLALCVKNILKIFAAKKNKNISKSSIIKSVILVIFLLIITIFWCIFLFTPIVPSSDSGSSWDEYPPIEYK